MAELITEDSAHRFVAVFPGAIGGHSASGIYARGLVNLTIKPFKYRQIMANPRASFARHTSLLLSIDTYWARHSMGCSSVAMESADEGPDNDA